MKNPRKYSVKIRKDLIRCKNGCVHVHVSHFTPNELLILKLISYRIYLSMFTKISRVQKISINLAIRAKHCGKTIISSSIQT